MRLSLTIPSQTQEELFASLCARGLSAEITYRPDGSPRQRSKVRFLDLAGDSLLVDPPTADGQPVRIEPGQTVRLYVLVNGQRLTFMTQVQGWRPSSEAGGVVDALILDVPRELERAQRRDSHRLNLAHLPPVVIRFSPPDAGTPPPESCAEAPAGAAFEPFEGVLVNLSETGAGVRLPEGPSRCLEIDGLYQACFALAGIEQEIVLPARLRWRQARPEAGSVLVGIVWEPDPSSPRSRARQHEVARFIAAEQIEILRRMRL